MQLRTYPWHHESFRFSSVGLLGSYLVSVLKRQTDASLCPLFQRQTSTPSSRCMSGSSTRNWSKPVLSLKRNKEKARLMFGGYLMMEVSCPKRSRGSGTPAWLFWQDGCVWKGCPFKNPTSEFLKAINHLIAVIMGMNKNNALIFFLSISLILSAVIYSLFQG